MTERDGAGAVPPKTTLVEEGTEFKGSLSSKCPVIVRGSVNGEVTAPSLTISPSGAVHGTVRVAELRSDGELSGEIEAGTVVLSGHVKDNTVIRAKTLEVKLSSPDGKMQVIFGEAVLDVGDAQEKLADAGPHKRGSLIPSIDRASTRPNEAASKGRGSARPAPDSDARVDAKLDALLSGGTDESAHANGGIKDENVS